MAGLWCVETGRDVHQRGLAGAIFAAEGMNLPGLAAEFRVIENDDPVKGLADSLKSETGRHEAELIELFLRDNAGQEPIHLPKTGIAEILSGGNDLFAGGIFQRAGEDVLAVDDG